jgi:DNA-binding protein H-NS
MMRLLFSALTIACLTFGAQAQDKTITIASTTSTQDSGLFNHLLPAFKAKTGIDVKVIAQGTGQALDTARRGDADVVFVHAKSAEEKFLADGFGVKRFDVMYNDFVLVGPAADPAAIKGSKDIVASLKTIQARIAELQKKAKALETKVKPGVDKVVALIKKHKLTLADLKHTISGKAGRPAKGAKKTKRVSKLKGKKAAVKFKDGSGNKWTGRGRTPLWIQAAEKAGKDRSSFAVK